jgi:hypothetical protein
MSQGSNVARAARSVAALDVVCRTRISPEIVTAATTYKAVWQSTFLPQFSGKLLTQNGAPFRGDWPFAIRGTNPNDEFGCRGVKKRDGRNVSSTRKQAD